MGPPQGLGIAGIGPLGALPRGLDQPERRSAAPLACSRERGPATSNVAP